MKIKDIVEKMNDLKVDSVDDLGKYMEVSDDVGNYMNEMAESGKKIVLQKISEQKLAIIFQIMRSTLLASMLLEGRGAGLAMTELSGDLSMYTDTLVLTVIGMLADEEII